MCISLMGIPVTTFSTKPQSSTQRPKLPQPVHELQAQFYTNKGSSLSVSSFPSTRRSRGFSSRFRRPPYSNVHSSRSQPLSPPKHKIRAATHVGRERPSHSRPETLPERRDTIRSNQFPGAVHEARVGPLGRGLEARLDGLRCQLRSLPAPYHPVPSSMPTGAPRDTWGKQQR